MVYLDIFQTISISSREKEDARCEAHLQVYEKPIHRWKAKFQPSRWFFEKKKIVTTRWNLESMAPAFSARKHAGQMSK